MLNLKIKRMIYASFFAAITAIASQIVFTLPVFPVPINLALLPVILSGALLGMNSGALSIIIYVLLGAVGLPVFSYFQGGLSYITGYTGGFIIGYILLSYIVGFLYRKLNANFFTSAFCGLFVCYLPGMLWFSYVAGCDLKYAFVSAVLPYIPIDIFKIFAAHLILKNKNIKSIFK